RDRGGAFVPAHVCGLADQRPPCRRAAAGPVRAPAPLGFLALQRGPASPGLRALAGRGPACLLQRRPTRTLLLRPERLTGACPAPAGRWSAWGSPPRRARGAAGAIRNTKWPSPAPRDQEPGARRPGGKRNRQTDPENRRGRRAAAGPNNGLEWGREGTMSMAE